MKSLYVKYNYVRKLPYQTCTRIVVDEKLAGLKLVEKRALSRHEGEKHIDSMERAYRYLQENLDHKLLTLPKLHERFPDRISFEYAEGVSLNALLFDAFLKKDQETFFLIIAHYYDLIKRSLKLVAKFEIAAEEQYLITPRKIEISEIKKEELFLERATLDVTLDNIIVPKGIGVYPYYLIDYEWVLTSKLPLNHLFIRALHSCFYSKYQIHGIEDFYPLGVVLQKLGINQYLLNQSVKIEKNFQEEIQLPQSKLAKNGYLSRKVYPLDYIVGSVLDEQKTLERKASNVLQVIFFKKDLVAPLVRRIITRPKLFARVKEVVVFGHKVFTKSITAVRLCYRGVVNTYERRQYTLFSGKLITAHIEGDVKKYSLGKLCLFAHYDPKGELATTTVTYLKALRELNFEIVFSSTSLRLNEETQKLLKPLCRDILIRRNVGIDFGSWKTALYHVTANEAGALNQYQKLLITNDSIYGPIQNLAPIIKKMDESRAFDVWGMTDSFERKYHLQSYFLMADRKVFLHPSWNKFWRSLKLYRNKYLIIDDYEVGLSRYLLRHKFKIGAYCSYLEIKAYLTQNPTAIPSGLPMDVRKTACNPSIYLWDVIIEHFNFPFVKRELFLNPKVYGILVKDRFEEVLRRNSFYSSQLIKKNIAQWKNIQ
ncbi:MAG: hypothetical protein HQK50_05480 [Oligoflexia bacterium]|nr:hypothetical protein [Oligoflexia bacterium]MBF0365000.1 hypothetical protein [Oligoflexia bacterium]